MGKTFRGEGRKKHKENYLKFKDKRKKRFIQDDKDSQNGDKDKKDRYQNFYEEEY